mgnify:CR=1 FL=1
MKTKLFALYAALSCLITPAAFAAEGETEGRGALIDGLVGFIYWLESIVFASVSFFGTEIELIVLWMAAPMLLLTFYFGFINLRGFKRAFEVLRGDFHDETAPGEVTQFQALATALSGTVGLGNIAGVAVAIAIGGPGATFWMILIGLFAMSLKFAECTLGVKYRVEHADGTVSGGPMYYLERGLSARGWVKSGKTLAWVYAIVAVFATLPQITQVNQAYSQFSGALDISGFTAELTYGLVLAGLTAVVIIGGIRSIANVTSRLVPFMTILYVGTAVIILGMNATLIPEAFATIFTNAFHPESVAGGIIGSFVAGMRRAVYSTEAGLGSATMAHAAAKTREPISEGMVALIEPFLDTVIICTMTALVIIITQAYTFTGHDGQLLGDIQMTSAAFGHAISWFPYILVLAVQLFAFSTIISWGYYSGKVWGFVFGEGERSMMIFKLLFCVALIPGAFFTSKEVYSLIDSLYFMMAIPNIIGIYIMAPELKRDLKDYLHRLKTGQIKKTRVPRNIVNTSS